MCTQPYSIRTEITFNWQSVRKNRGDFFIRSILLISVSVEHWISIFIGISIISQDNTIDLSQLFGNERFDIGF